MSSDSLQLACDKLPEKRVSRSSAVPHAPNRNAPLTADERAVAIGNALRYIRPEWQTEMAEEAAAELHDYGHIYLYRLMPHFDLRARPLSAIGARNGHSAAIVLMLLNNLDAAVAQFPHELVTYGGNGQVFANWAQFRLAVHYLLTMSERQTLVLYSGHPLGLFPSTEDSPRLVITNGMMVPNYSSKEHYDKYFAMGTTMYGQMTAGSFCYIGPQGIVHGTTITVLNAGRKYLGSGDLRGRVLVTSGLGGMSGAQSKAGVIAGCVAVVAEVCESALLKRKQQGWLDETTDCLDECVALVRKARRAALPTSIGYLGNVVDLWERLVAEYERTGDLLADLGSDQTSCHNAYNGGYYPVGVSFDEANEMMVGQPARFKALVQQSLLRQVAAIDRLAAAGMRFWDYGNAFLLECERAGAHVKLDGDSSGTRFRYPSYVQDIMGDVFSLGFGPFRWVCTSCEAADLRVTDAIAAQTLRSIMQQSDVPENTKQQYEDNLKWITEADGHNLVVGSQARILYSDQQGRVALALAFNEAVADGRLKSAVVISRDHHDVSGADSPFRETSNITDGSAFTADMAVQNCIGDAFRGATWVALHNGGGVGWGEAINGGFGLVLDGTHAAATRARRLLDWDVSNGVARRCWSGSALARQAIERAMQRCDDLRVTLPHPLVANVGRLKPPTV